LRLFIPLLALYQAPGVLAGSKRPMQLPIVITEGAMFRRLVGRGRVGGRLDPDIIADIHKRVARWIGMPSKQVEQVSGHSLQAGRWKSTRMRKPKDATMRAKRKNDAAPFLRGLIP
jgi:hypothetical protein